VGGGGGGTPRHDGPNGAGGAQAFLKNTPVEINEAEVPIRILRYGLERDSAGPGQYRGGLAAVMEVQVFAPGTVVTARNRNRSVFQSWGACGGRAGGNSRFLRNPGTPEELSLGNTDIVKCNPGDIVRVIGPGAGGYGDPFTRTPEAVLTDVRRGFVSVEAAARDYGVAIVDGAVDGPATTALRAGHAPRQGFDYGARRDAFEAVWSRARYEELTTALARVPVQWRHYLKGEFFRAVAAGTYAELGERAQMRRLAEDMLKKHGLDMPLAAE